MRCPHAYDDGAYVVGSLSTDERRSFVNHLPGCPDCRESVRQLSNLPGLLANVDTAESGVLGGAPLDMPPPSLWPRLLNRANSERARKRRRGRAFAVAACLAILLAVAAPVALFAPFSPLRQGVGTTDVAMHSMKPVGGRAMVSAKIGVTNKAWGTKVALHCSYGDVGYAADQAYALFAVSRNNSAEQIGSWMVGPGQEITTDAATRFRLADLAALEIRRGDGTTVLRSQF